MKRRMMGEIDNTILSFTLDYSYASGYEYVYLIKNGKIAGTYYTYGVSKVIIDNISPKDKIQIGGPASGSVWLDIYINGVREYSIWDYEWFVTIDGVQISCLFGPIDNKLFYNDCIIEYKTSSSG